MISPRTQLGRYFPLLALFTFISVALLAFLVASLLSLLAGCAAPEPMVQAPAGYVQEALSAQATVTVDQERAWEVIAALSAGFDAGEP